MRVKVGIFKTEDLDNYVKLVDSKFLKKYGIKINTDTEKHVEISGPILKLENIRKYSNKFAKIIEHINNFIENEKGTMFIYLEDIEGIGIKLFANILNENGYLDMNSNNSLDNNNEKKFKIDNEMYSAKYAILSGMNDSFYRKKIIDKFNNINNIDGKNIKIILGSSVAKESITLLGIRQIIIVNYQYDFSSIEQIIGRGIRTCSHKNVPRDEWNVKIYKYVTSMPNLVDSIKYENEKINSKDIEKKLLKIIEENNKYIGKKTNSKNNSKTIKKIFKDPNKYYLQSAEEREYNIQEKEHIIIKKIERYIKEGSIDCALNKEGNVFSEEVKKYKDCEKTEDSIMCNSLCDYQECDYKCDFEPFVNKKGKFNQLDLKDLDKDTFTKQFAYKEINFVKECIKELFKFNTILTLEDIIDYIYNKKDVNIEYLEKKYIYILLFMK